MKGCDRMYNINNVIAARNDLRDYIDLNNRKLDHVNDHSLRVSEMAVKMAIAINLPSEDITQILIGSYLHDIGKIFLDKEILDGNLPLTPIQRAEMENHTILGYEYLKDITGLDKAKEIILMHHEKIDGSGYPKGLLGYEIPTHVKIVSICDSYDAMTSYRAYKKCTLSHAEAIKELLENKNTQFDSDLVDIFIKEFHFNNSNI
ncbi:MAG: HD domain-containing protein [Bacilli bacterium]|nr:HD domain-containing protein [Bacilli bacterium]